MPQASRRLLSAVGEAGADTERKSESEAAKSQTSNIINGMKILPFGRKKIKITDGMGRFRLRMITFAD